MTDLIYFLPILFGFGSFIAGRYYRDVTLVTLGSISLFLSGVAMLINPISSLDSLSNTFFGVIIWGVGAYLLIRNYIEYWESKNA